MRRSTIVLFVFVVLGAAVIAASQLLRSQDALQVRLAVDPLAADWVRESVERYNATEPLVGARRVQIILEEASDVDVWRGNVEWNNDNHPAGWIPASSTSLAYASTLPFTEVTPSLAQTVLVWGGFSSRIPALTQNGNRALDWDSLSAIANSSDGNWATIPFAESSWGFLKFAFPTPERSMSGLAVLFSGAADFADNPALVGTITSGSEFRTWMEPIVLSVPNFQTLGADPAAALASRGTSVADLALLPESVWLANINSLTASGRESLAFAYPEYQFVFDFPLALWDAGTLTTDDERTAIRNVGAWLSQQAQQNRTVDFGLRPASGVIPVNAALFTAGANNGILLELPVSQLVQPPSRIDAQSLVQWFTQVR